MRGVSLAKIATLSGDSPEVCRRRYAAIYTEALHVEVAYRGARARHASSAWTYNRRTAKEDIIVDEAWLRSANDRLSAEGVAPRARPWKAVGLLAKALGRSVQLDEPEVCALFRWFEANSRPGTHAIGTKFDGVFYFDGDVWPIFVPVIFGEVRVDVRDATQQMPESVRERLLRSSAHAVNFLSLWADCLDYAYGIEELREQQQARSFAKALAQSGDKELRASVQVLLARNPSQKAIEAARMAVEMFLKAILAFRAGLDEKGARRIGHDLDKALDQVLKVEPSSDLRRLLGKLDVFPPLDARYTSATPDLARLWRGYSIAQFVGTCLVRRETGRDCRDTIRPVFDDGAGPGARSP